MGLNDKDLLKVWQPVTLQMTSDEHQVKHYNNNNTKMKITQDKNEELEQVTQLESE